MYLITITSCLKRKDNSVWNTKKSNASGPRWGFRKNLKLPDYCAKWKIWTYVGKCTTFFSKCILKKKFFGPLKFAIFEVKSQFFSILLSKFNFKNSYLLGRVTIPLFCLYGVKIQRQDLIWVVSNVWNCDTP